MLANMTLAIVSCIYLSDCLSTHLSIICFISSTLCLYTHISYSLKLLRVVVIYISVNVGGGKEPNKDVHFHPCYQHHPECCSQFAEARKRNKRLTRW